MVKYSGIEKTEEKNMYLRNKRIRNFKIINFILALITVANMTLAVSFEIYLAVRYQGDTFTLIHARNTSDFIFWIIAGPIILFHLYRSRSRMEDATFYSGYFEGDLDGTVSAEDLAEVTGKKISKIKRQLNYFPKIYMKNYTCKDGSAILASKTVTCDCQSCGGVFEKKLYFTGECPYCGSSDLQARILTDGKFYSISNEMKGKTKSYTYYTSKTLPQKQILFPILMGISLFIMAICIGDFFTSLGHYNDHDYLVSVIMDPESNLHSFELVNYDLIYSMITCGFIVAALIPVLINRIRRLIFVKTADTTAVFLSTRKTPFISASSLPSDNKKNGEEKLSLVRHSIRCGYLKNCTIEKHGGVLQLALAKKIVKDRCPNCGGAIVGAVDKDYICRYCDSKIMDVVVKK